MSIARSRRSIAITIQSIVSSNSSASSLADEVEVLLEEDDFFDEEDDLLEEEPLEDDFLDPDVPLPYPFVPGTGNLPPVA